MLRGALVTALVASSLAIGADAIGAAHDRARAGGSHPNADAVVRCNPAFARVANLSMFKSNPDRWRLNNRGAAKRPGDDDAAAHPTKAPAKRPKAKHHAKKVETIKDASSMRDILKLAGDLHKKK